MKTKNIIEPKLEDLLLSLRRAIIEACRASGLRQDLTFSQSEILRFIGPTGSATMKAIATNLKISPPSASVLVAELEKKGFVVRKPGATDRRIVSITFTKKAQDLYQVMMKEKERVLTTMTKRLSSKDKKELERIITILIN